MQSAGNLATTQEVLDRIDRDLATAGGHESLATVGHLFEAALYVGRLSRRSRAEHATALGRRRHRHVHPRRADRGDRPDILLVYPEGNYIRASDERPFLQIGESKYGKFMLELAVARPRRPRDAAKIALSSMVSTARANLSVGPPYDIGIYRNGAFDVDEYRSHSPSRRFSASSKEVWERHQLNAIAELPDVELSELRAAAGRVAD